MAHDLTPVADRITRAFQPRSIDLCRLEAGLGDIYGDSLRQVRGELGWCQQQAARVLGVSCSQYRKYERGDGFARMGNTARYMLATGVPFHYFFLGSGYTCLFDDFSIRRSWLPLQIFAGRSSRATFDSLIHLLGEQLPLPPLPAQPCPHPVELPVSQVDIAVDQYYAQAANGLRLFRELVGISQEALAELMRITPRTLSRYECPHADSHFTVVTVLRLWACTGVPPLWLAHGTDFFYARMCQHQRMDYLMAWLGGLPEALLNEVMDWVRRLMRETGMVSA